MKPRWRRKKTLFIFNRKKEKQKNKYTKAKEDKTHTDIQTETFNKIENQQILCHDKIKTRCGHLSVADYLGRDFTNQRYGR